MIFFFFKQMPHGRFYSSLENKVLQQQREGEWSVLPMVVIGYFMYSYIVENLFLDYSLENLVLKSFYHLKRHQCIFPKAVSFPPYPHFRQFSCIT